MTDGASAAGDELDATLALRDLLSEVTARFAAAAIDGAEREARWIVEEASGHEGPEFALSLDRPATEREVVRIDAMTARRVAGEPLQYVLGRWAFRHLDLAVDSRVLIPRAETEVTAEVAIDAARRVAEPIVVDLGTGSGAIGLSVAWECRHAHVWATDRSSEALEVARANLAGLGRAGARVRLAAGDWFGALPDDLVGRVDVAVSNPPYVRLDDPLPPAVERWEPAAAGAGRVCRSAGAAGSGRAGAGDHGAVGSAPGAAGPASSLSRVGSGAPAGTISATKRSNSAVSTSSSKYTAEMNAEPLNSTTRARTVPRPAPSGQLS